MWRDFISLIIIKINYCIKSRLLFLKIKVKEEIICIEMFHKKFICACKDMLFSLICQLIINFFRRKMKKCHRMLSTTVTLHWADAPPHDIVISAYPGLRV